MVYLYAKKLPKKDYLVHGEVMEVNEYGINVKLTDYNDITGFISTNETSRMRKKQLKTMLAVGVKTTLIVIAVDNIKGFVDLSKHNISKEEVEAFDKKRKLHIILYNFFKYVLFKLKGYEKIYMIQEDELELFLTCSLWEIQKKFDSNENIHSMLFDQNQNEQILEEMDYSNTTYTLESIKAVVDNYIVTKIHQSKSSGRKEFKLLTYKITGVDDIKHVTNIKNFSQYEEISKNYEIKINYETNTVYTLYLEQKIFSDEDVNVYLEQISSEIKQRAKEKEVMYY
jgi:translation initiation factor 2 subunit 1